MDEPVTSLASHGVKKGIKVHVMHMVRKWKGDRAQKISREGTRVKFESLFLGSTTGPIRAEIGTVFPSRVSILWPRRQLRSDKMKMLARKWAWMIANGEHFLLKAPGLPQGKSKPGLPPTICPSFCAIFRRKKACLFPLVISYNSPLSFLSLPHYRYYSQKILFCAPP